MTFLLAIEEPEIREIIAFCLSKTYDCQIIEAASSDDLKKVIVDGHSFRTVISDFPGFASEVSSLLSSSKTNAEPISIIMSHHIAAREKAASMDWTFRVTKIVDCSSCIQQLIDYLNILPAGEIEKNKFTGEYEDIQVNLLLRTSPLPEDIYLRLGRNKFVKLFLKNDFIGTEDYEKYGVIKKIKHLYFKHGHVSKYISVLKSVLSTMERPPKPIPDTVESNNAHSALTQDNVLEKLAGLESGIAIDRDVQDVVNKSVKDVVKLMGATPKLKNILNSLIRDKDKYITAHSLMVANIACAIAKGLQWGSEATFMKLTMAAFLHDCALSNQKLAAVRDLTELENRKAEFSEEEILAYKNHSLVAAELAKSFYEIPKDVDMIIVQHHERADGTGFPKGLSHSRMHPMAAVFIIAHDAVDYFYSQEGEGPLDVNKFIEIHEKIYVGANFKKALRSMGELMKAKT